jgi:hypothetical protein
MTSSVSRSWLSALAAARTRLFAGTGGADGEVATGGHEPSGHDGVTNRRPVIRVGTGAVRRKLTPGYRVGLPTERGQMTDPIPIPDGRDLIRTMGWIPLPYSCAGLVRKTAVSGRNTVWSWLILIPWASDSKPWIDGTEVVGASTKSEDEERDDIVALLRGILDQRYGETVGNRVVDDLLRSILEDE